MRVCGTLLPCGGWIKPLGASSGLQAPQDSLAGRGASGTLRDPSVVGRPRQPTAVRGDEAEIQAIEQRLACSCGCTLDIFTCRTTDFTCTYSPALHREVLALRDEGKTAQQMVRLMEARDDHDDVQHVWSNFDIEEKEIEASLA